MSSTEQATPSTAAHVPTEEEVLTYFDRFSNWGRWGADDQAGTLNFITAEKRLQAARLVQDGTTVSLAKLLTTDLSVDIKPPLFPAPTHFMLQNGEQFHQCGNEPYVLQTALDYFGVAFHNVAVTHLDAVGHVFWDGKMYNGVSSKSVSTIGATVQSVDVAKDGIVSRGVLLDIPKLRGVKWLEPGDIIRVEELEAAEAAAGIRVEEGDVLFVRTGSARKRAEEGPWDMYVHGVAGLGADCLEFIHSRGVAVLGSDGGSDAAPSGYEVVFQPIHQVGLVAMGLWLVDFADLDPVAAACEARGRWEFMLSLGALRIQYGTGSPVNPIAIF
jgi:kynurenine formamidase